MEVLNELKPGLDEKLYERAMVIGLQSGGHVVDVQRSYPVHFRNQLIGTLVPDLIVDNLSITGLELALLLNFKNARLTWKRVVRQQQNDAPAPDLRA